MMELRGIKFVLLPHQSKDDDRLLDMEDVGGNLWREESSGTIIIIIIIVVSSRFLRRDVFFFPDVSGGSGGS